MYGADHRVSPPLRRALCLVGALAMVAACGPEAETPPTAVELAARLVTVDDYAGEWTVNAGPDGTGASGVLTEEQQTQVPRLSICERAPEAARRAAEELRWMAFRQIDLTVDDPIEPPDDRTGRLVFVQEFLTAAPAAEIEKTFELLRDGAEACYGEMPAGDEGQGRADPLAMPEVGDDRFGVRFTLEEAGGWAEWRVYTGIVRDGPVLKAITVGEIFAGVEPSFTVEEIGRMVRLAVEKG